MGVLATSRNPFAVPIIQTESPRDICAREALLDRVMGPERKKKASERLRVGQIPAVALVAQMDGRLVGTVRTWTVKACGLGPAMLLGPLAVDQSLQGLGIGGALLRTAIKTACAQGASAIILAGDPDYYQRFGFTARAARRLSMPGPFERHRLLGLELHPGALARAHGVLKSGAFVPNPVNRPARPDSERSGPALPAANIQI